jgi:hypothetical protein
MNARIRAIKFGVFAGFLLICAPGVSGAAELTNETLQAWQDYIRSANLRMEERLHGRLPFLWIDESTDRGRRVRAGEVVVSTAGDHSPIRARKGLIHDWIGAALIQDARLEDVFAVVHDYNRYREFYRPLVIDSKSLGADGPDNRFSLLMQNKSLFAKVALASEWNDRYICVDDRRWYSIAYSTRVEEIEDYGLPRERKLPLNEGSGYIWRLYGFSRFEQRDDGVYVELEVISLSRDIPGPLRWLIDPIVRRVSRGSLLTSLTETRAAVRSSSSLASSGPSLAAHATESGGEDLDTQRRKYPNP